MTRTLMCSLVLLAATVAANVEPSTALAQTEQLDEAARLTFESAREAFVAGNYEVALERFRQAYQLSQRPGLLYNIAQTLDRLRRDDETVEALRQYLAAAPDAPNRAEVESRIQLLDRAIAERRAAQPQQSSGPTAGAPSPSSSIGVLHPGIFFGTLGLTLAGAGVLTWSGLETLALNDAYLATTDYAAASSAFNIANDQQMLTNVFAGVTAGLGALSVIFAVLSDWQALSGESAAQASSPFTLRPLLHAGPGGAMLGLDARF